ncbi:MAG: Gfo/Idh/MocA family oxidoreductase [Verrucomicrobiota bacterium]
MSGIAKVGIIGAGNISPQYLNGCKLYENVEVVALADINLEAAKARADEFGVPTAQSVDELLANPEVEIVLNITTPQFHAPVNKRILEAGKHAYCEKPFATTREEGLEVLEIAREKGLYVGCAPDTFMAGTCQLAAELIATGVIGEPVAAVANLLVKGHEHWHPNPEFYYKVGGGPLFDMGPYYLTALASALGPVASVMASAKMTYPQRTILSEPLNGTVLDVECFTHYNGILEFANGVTANTTFSFDTRGKHDLPMLIIQGTEGALKLPDPNRFEGVVELSKDMSDWEPQTLNRKYRGCRSIGLADMAAAIREGRPMRANGELAYQVFDVMMSYEESTKAGKRVEVASRFERPALIPATEGELPVF